MRSRDTFVHANWPVPRKPAPETKWMPRGIESQTRTRMALASPMFLTRRRTAAVPPGETIDGLTLLWIERRVPTICSGRTPPPAGGTGGSGGPGGSGGSGVGGGIGSSGTTTRVTVSSRLGCGSGTGSFWSPSTVATLRSTVPSAVDAGTVALMSSVSDVPAATLGAVQVIAPPAPTGGVVHVSAALCVRLTNATPGGSSSASTKPVDVPGP
jgi:hypothetical protein